MSGIDIVFESDSLHIVARDEREYYWGEDVTDECIRAVGALYVQDPTTVERVERLLCNVDHGIDKCLTHDIYTTQGAPSCGIGQAQARAVLAAIAGESDE